MFSVPTRLPTLLTTALSQPPQQPIRAVLEVIPLQHERRGRARRRWLSPPRQVVPAASLDLAEVATQRIAHDGSVTAGRPIAHGDGPTVEIAGRQRRSAVETTVRW